MATNAAPSNDSVRSDRALLLEAQREGKQLSAFVKLSGPGWLQSATTLGGGSLAGSLFLGVLGGTSLLWLQIVAITMGVIMLSAISYVTLSTGRRPFEAINREINPALGWGWLIATAMANMIWCMPQFSLCYDALDKNLFTIGDCSGLGDEANTKWLVTAVIFVAAGVIVLLNVRRGRAAWLFDVFLKSLISTVVFCFFGVAALLILNGDVDLSSALSGLVPDLRQWRMPTGELHAVVSGMPPVAAQFWTDQLVANQRTVMIAAAATAVGINMTFLMPYSMIARGWDKPFRGLAQFDLATGMAIPFVLVTSCVVIASSASFHNRIDDQLASNDLAVMEQSPLFEAVKPSLLSRINTMLAERSEQVDEQAKVQMMAELSSDEKRIATALVKRDAFQLSQTLTPLLGEANAKLVFGLGVFGMGFSSIIILMLINGYAFREMVGSPEGTVPFVVGVLVAGLSGASWVWLWSGGAKFWLAIFASTFGMMLLPIAYITFFLMMNSKRILGDDRPTGTRRWIWNIAMGISVAGALAAAYTAIVDKANDPLQPAAYPTVITLLILYAIAVAAGFLFRHRTSTIASNR
ncbi:divalent metal cation transporter [Rhodopirellula sallentina]|uniref:Putative membrane protein n=1 Tax=Rhodopirellula sallentina SM41 TaxID=1263870 RepID=M5U9B1_9BACT|nr:divalent metal cation transporter [Rhodopirellula sallentina]EMI58042.1 putative membrane protein [Rhodopirellula sallentina SM41]